jgi:hypothetical protein
MNRHRAPDIQIRGNLIHRRGSLILLIVIMLVPAIMPVSAYPSGGIRSQLVKLADGASSSIKGVIRGNESVSYVFSAHAGQRLSVKLKTSNGSNFFNIYAPGRKPGDEALYAGSLSDNEIDGTLTESGYYTVSVYLMRSAARRNETARYTLNVTLGNGNGATAPSALRWPATHDASGQLRCINLQAQSNTWCDFRVKRSPGAATIWVVRPENPQALRVLYFENKTFSTDDTSKMSWRREGDNFRITVGENEMYIIPDAALYGD